VAGLTADHLEALALGSLTLDDIGRELGCSKQALSKAIKKRTAPKSTPTAAEPKPVAEPATIDFSTPEGIKEAIDETSLALLYAMRRDMGRIVADERSQLGPRATKDMANALATIRADLTDAGILPVAGARRTIPALIIQTMTEEEEREIRAAIEAETTDRQQIGGEESPQGLAESQPENGAAEIAPASQPETPPQYALGLRPDVWKMLLRVGSPEEFRTVLAAYGEATGARMLRQIAEALGLPADRQDSHAVLVDRIAVAWPSVSSSVEKALEAAN
jgi:hypothetical protein